MSWSTREPWLLKAAGEVEKIFFPLGYRIPKVRIGVGWPTRKRDKVGGQCFNKDASADETYEIFISPMLTDPVQILAVLIHELCHTVAGTEAQHKKPFIEVMRAVGMVKPWTGSEVGDDLVGPLNNIAESLGDYPHAALTIEKKLGKKGSRLLKVLCPECGYTVRVTRKWLDAAGPPWCPLHKIAFEEEIVDPEYDDREHDRAREEDQAQENEDLNGDQSRLPGD